MPVPSLNLCTVRHGMMDGADTWGLWEAIGTHMVARVYTWRAKRNHACRWFHDTLVDGDLAINSMMWQNAGKSGLDQWNFTLLPTSTSQVMLTSWGTHIQPGGNPRLVQICTVLGIQVFFKA